MLGLLEEIGKEAIGIGTGRCRVRIAVGHVGTDHRDQRTARWLLGPDADGCHARLGGGPDGVLK